MSFVERLSSLGAGTVSRVLCREVVTVKLVWYIYTVPRRDTNSVK